MAIILPFQACTVGPRAYHDSGPRKAKMIDLVVIHSAEASDPSGPDRTAEGVANYFALQTTRASTQLAIDSDSCVRMLPDLIIPWGAAGANHDGLHIEICGRAGWDRSKWLNERNRKMLNLAAAKGAKWAWQYSIPRRWLTVSELKQGKRGFTTHSDVNQAFRRGEHWDPGPDFPRDWFMSKVRYWYAKILEERGKLA